MSGKTLGVSKTSKGRVKEIKAYVSSLRHERNISYFEISCKASSKALAEWSET